MAYWLPGPSFSRGSERLAYWERSLANWKEGSADQALLGLPASLSRKPERLAYWPPGPSFPRRSERSAYWENSLAYWTDGSTGRAPLGLLASRPESLAYWGSTRPTITFPAFSENKKTYIANARKGTPVGQSRAPQFTFPAITKNPNNAHRQHAGRPGRFDQ